jgi:glycosyltransferase involved in cell wall biosynthesis
LAASHHIDDDGARLPITIYLSALQGGGAEHMMVKLANHFAEAGHTTTLLVNHRGGPQERRLSDRVNIRSLDAANTWSAIPRLARYLASHRPPVVLTAMTYANIVALLARRFSGATTRIVISERNTTSEWLNHRNWLRRGLDRSLIRLLYPRSDALIAVSQGVADDLARVVRMPRCPITVIYNPTVDDSTWRSLEEEPDHRWLKEPGPPVIVSAGKFRPQKDFTTLIRAFALVRRRRAARLIILGEGPGRARLESAVGDLALGADVSLPGYVHNPLCYFKRASTFVLSSVFEGFPNVLVEALASGVAVVSTDCPSGPREILAGGKFGALVSMFTIEAAGPRYLDVLRDVRLMP